VHDFLQDRNISVLPWPEKSPDLNPIEHILDLLDRNVRARGIPPRNVRELAGALVDTERTGKYGAVHEEEMHYST
jgi:transposase